MEQPRVLDRVRARLFSPTGLIFFILGPAALVVAGPFGTFWAMSVGVRAIYWTGVVWSSIIMAVFLREFLAEVLRDRLSLWAQELVTSLSFTLVFTPVLYLMTDVARSPSEGTYMSAYAMGGVVLFVCFLISVVRFVFLTQKESGAGAQVVPLTAVPTTPRPRLYSRLTGVGEASICHIESDNHHVQVWLSDGRSIRLRLRFADAVAEMDGVEGMVVHRSHWVARAAISESVRENSRDFVRLTCGTMVPVGRTYRPEVAAEGLLKVAS